MIDLRPTWKTDVTLGVAVLVAALGAAALADPQLDENRMPMSHVTVTQTAITEDTPAWDCRVNGNRVCGPHNAQDVTPGCYNDAAELVAAWPCHVVTLPNGEQDVYSEPQGSR